MTQPARTFRIGQVLTLACADADAHQAFCAYGELLEVLGYMLADVPMADDIPAAIARCRPAVIEQHPALADVEPPPVTAPDTTVLQWITEQENAHGAELALDPIEAAR